MEKFGTRGKKEQWLEQAEIPMRTRNKKWRKLRTNSESENENRIKQTYTKRNSHSNDFQRTLTFSLHPHH